MAKAKEETKEVVAAGNSLPAHLQGGKTAKFGNTDQTDRILPRVKLLQSVSPELDAYDNAKKGEFWHNVASESMGSELRAVPVIVRKSFVLWSPRGDERGVLARANDGLHWDMDEGMEFEVKPKNSPHKVKYKLGATVHDRVDGHPALSEFGSSIPGDKNSPPAAALTYQFLWWFPDFKSYSPSVMINTRSSIKPAKDLLSKIDLRPVDSFGQQYKITVVKNKNGAGEEFFNYMYVSDGYAEKDDYDAAKALYEQFSKQGWRTDDDSDDTHGDDLDAGGGEPKRQGNTGGKSGNAF